MHVRCEDGQAGRSKVAARQWMFVGRGRVCAATAGSGLLHVLKWARSQGCPWDVRVVNKAIICGRSHVFGWTLANGCPAT